MKNMKNRFSAISQTGLIEVEVNSIEQYASQSRLVIKGNSILHSLESIPLAGYGSCRACDCKGWIPNDPKNNYCKNCGHHYDRHH